MSKESKGRDRWRQVHAASAADRPVDYCIGCGYYLATRGHHRTDCTAPPLDDQETSQQCRTSNSTGPTRPTSPANAPSRGYSPVTAG